MPIANELNINTSATALDMANTMFGDGVTVVSATYSGDSIASGTYTGGISTLGELSPSDQGVILSTGRASDITNSSGTTNTNTSDGTSSNTSGVDGDADMNAISGQSTFDGAFLESTFIPSGDTLTMQLVFSSEEYLEYVNGGVNDAIGVWVNGTYVPMQFNDTTDTDISIDTINDTSNENLYLDNPRSSDTYNTEMDGSTVVLSLTAPVVAGAENTIRIGIADGGDSSYDSNLLIMADSVQTVNIANSDHLAQGPNTTQVHNILANDDGSGHTITHINNTAVSPGDTVVLNTGEQVTLNADGTISITTDGDIDTNTFTYSTVDANGTPATGYVNIETTNNPPDFIVEGTGGNDLIDETYAGDPEGDQIEHYDHSDASNDDSVVAGAGNDTVYSGIGNDTVLGEAGNDVLDGGAGDDRLLGGTGDDIIEGGSGDDTIYGDEAPQPGTWDYQVYDYNFASASDQAFDIENGTLVGEGQTGSFDATNLVNDARGTTGDPNDFGMIYTSRLVPSEDGTYTFSTTSDDGSSIRILDENGNPLTWTNQDGSTATFMDNDYLQGANTRSGEITLEAGRVYTIEVRHWENEGAEVISGTVTSPSGSTENLATSSMIIGPETAGGNDSLSGGDGNDVLDGGSGDDSLDGGTGGDQLLGGDGDDAIIVDQGDTAFGGSGDDTFTLQDLDTTGTGNDSISITGGEGGETNGDTLILTPDVSWQDITYTNTDDDAGGLSGSFTMADGTFVQFSEIENIICFTPGTNILTQHGERRIETLEVGDMVLTRDHGMRPIRWIGQRTVRGHGNFAPVTIGASVMDGARCGLTVSPQHRILFTGYRAELLFGESEVLIPAKHLIDGRDVIQRDCDEVTYIHIMFDCHEVIYAEGIATESFHAGDVGLSAVCEDAREELFTIFPELRSAPGDHLETARPCLKQHEARILVHQQVSDNSQSLWQGDSFWQG